MDINSSWYHSLVNNDIENHMLERIARSITITEAYIPKILRATRSAASSWINKSSQTQLPSRSAVFIIANQIADNVIKAMAARYPTLIKNRHTQISPDSRQRTVISAPNELMYKNTMDVNLMDRSAMDNSNINQAQPPPPFKLLSLGDPRRMNQQITLTPLAEAYGIKEFPNDAQRQQKQQTYYPVHKKYGDNRVHPMNQLNLNQQISDLSRTLQ